MSPENNKQSGASPLLRELTAIIREILNSAVLISGESPDKDEQSGVSPLLCRV